MTDQKTDDDAQNGDEDDEDLEAEDERIPDESTLVGAEGVEEEVLAELARAEAKLSDPSAPDDDPEAEGAQV
jgi:hypothetical protein